MSRIFTSITARMAETTGGSFYQFRGFSFPIFHDFYIFCTDFNVNSGIKTWITIFLSINNNFVKHDCVECISHDFVSVFGHSIGYEFIYKCDPVRLNQEMFNHHLLALCEGIYCKPCTDICLGFHTVISCRLRYSDKTKKYRNKHSR